MAADRTQRPDLPMNKTTIIDNDDIGTGDDEINLRILQINLGKGKAASDLLNEHTRRRNWDIIAIQEPYHRQRPPNKYKEYKNSTTSKTIIYAKEDLGAILIKQGTTDNWTKILIEQEGNKLEVVCMYDEPKDPGRSNPSKFLEWTKTEDSKKGRLIVVGDLNAHNSAWGGDDTDERGADIMDWTLSHNMIIENDPESEPTYESTAGRKSWVDLTMTRDVSEVSWRILEDESLSDHKYIETTIKLGRIWKKRKGTNISVEDIDLTKLRQELEKEIPEWTGNEDLETKVEKIQKFCMEAIRRTRKKKGKKRKGSNAWWTQELENMRKEVRIARREYQREDRIEIKEMRRQRFKTMRNEYKRKIEEEKRNKFVETIEKEGEREPWKVTNKILRKKSTRNEPLGTVKKLDGTWTKSESETIQYWMKKYFPTKNEGEEWDRWKRKEYTKEDDKNFTEIELRALLKTLGDKKATVSEDMPNEVAKILIECKEREILEVLNGCLSRGQFPKKWKDAEIIWLPKKDGSKRPICLLATMGKILDKLVSKRIMHFLEINNKLNENQHGFRTAHDTLGAVHKVIERMRENRKEGIHSVVVTLDMKNAFNSIEHREIMERLEQHELPRNLIKIARSFLEERTIVSQGVTMPVDRGCPQGSSLGPTLWLAGMEGWFNRMGQIELLSDRDLIQAFADDQIIIISGSSLKTIERKWEEVWKGCLEWSIEAGLEYNPDKTEAIFVNGKGKRDTREPRLKIGDETLRMNRELTYLGIKLDRQLLFLEHTKTIRKKIQLTSNRLFIVAGKTWGASKKTRKTIYECVVKPMILYGAEVWGGKALDTRLQRQLDATQRPYLLAITNAYRTTSTAALQVLAGCPPLDILAKQTNEVYAKYREASSKTRISERNRPHPSGQWRFNIEEERSLTQEGETIIYTDASESPEGAGLAAVMETRNGWEEKTRAIEKYGNIHDAEMNAVRMGLEWMVERRQKGRIITDSKNTLTRLRMVRVSDRTVAEIQNILDKSRGDIKITWAGTDIKYGEGIKRADRAAKTARNKRPTPVNEYSKKEMKREKEEGVMQQWQRRWDTIDKGRTTYKLVREVGVDILELDRKAIQLVTGHGNMKGYLKRFKLADTDGRCECGQANEDTEHILTDCTKRQDERHNMIRLLEEQGRELQLRQGNEEVREIVRILNEFAERAIETPEYLEDR